MPKKIIVYQGPIHKVLANDFKLVQGAVQPVIQKIIVREKSEFLDLWGKGFTNIDYGYVLPDYEEAIGYLSHTIDRHEREIYQALSNPNTTPRDLENMKERLAVFSACSYYEPRELIPARTISKEEFKMLKKEIKKRS